MKQRGQSLVEIALGLALLVGIGWIIWYMFISRPFWKEAWFTGENQKESSSVSSGTYIEFNNTAELEQWRVDYFNVDVKVNSSHAWLQHHSQAQEALKCVNRYGVQKAISENNTRNLHLICQDPETGNTFVVIITKIKKAIDIYSNATADLITAFQLTGGQTAEMYIYNETVTKAFAIVVKLWFSAGEIFFMPY